MTSHHTYIATCRACRAATRAVYCGCVTTGLQRESRSAAISCTSPTTMPAMAPLRMSTGCSA